MSNLLLAFGLIALIALTACGHQTRPGDFTPEELQAIQRTLK